MTETPTVKRGDVFYRSWGYDQTNVNFYVVTAVSKTGKTATFMEVWAACETENGSYQRMTADLEAAVCANCLSAIRPLVKVTGETVWRHVGSNDERCSRYRDDDTRTATPEIFKRRVKKTYSGQTGANYNSYSSLYAWDGKSKYQTDPRAGH
jgi:hypothetical protein